MLLVDLPDVILKYLQSFLTNDDILYFVNSNKSHFSSLKQEIIYFSLNRKKSREYVEDEKFREMILSKVKDGSKQIGLTFHRMYKLPNRDIVADTIDFGESYPHFLPNVTSQGYYEAEKEIPFLPRLEELELVNCVNIKDFSNLSHLKRLELEDALHLTDITPLQNIPDLTFNNCPNIQDFSVLNSKKQMSLSIIESPITDVSFLRNIQTVKLELCDLLVDVSPLHGVKNLILQQCSGIRDISGLGNHHRFNIYHCDSIERGFECFRTVRCVTVRELKVPDLSVFQKVKSLGITFFSSMKSQLFLLKDIPELNLFSSSWSNDKGKEVYEISHLRSIRLNIYDDIITINNSNFPSQLRYLVLKNCDQIVKIINEGKTSIFDHLQSLHLSDCSIEHVNGLGDIPTVILSFCSELDDISGLGRNRSVEIQYCPHIRDVSSLATVPIVVVRNCHGIIDYNCLSSVPRLKIVRYSPLNPND